MITLKAPSLSLVFEDKILSEVEQAWRKLLGSEADSLEFLTFEPRAGEEDEDDEYV